MGSTSTDATGVSCSRPRRPDRVGRRRTSPDLRAAIKTRPAERRDRRPDRQGASRRQGLDTAPLVPRTCPGSGRGRARRLLASPGSSTTRRRPSGTRSGSSSGSSGSSSRCSSAGPRPGCVRQNEDLAQRSHDLVESSRELEATLLETIETLNAAVEARDPYTAGHSQRVRRVSLAIGRELRLPAKQLGALGDGRALPRHRQDRDARTRSSPSPTGSTARRRRSCESTSRAARRSSRGSPRSETPSRRSATTTSVGTASATRTG